MLSIFGSPRRLCDGWTRRELLTIGALGVGGLALPDLLRAEARAGVRQSKKAIIMIYMCGAPPHQDMYDLKTEAPAEIRGEFQPIATNVPGIQICEHLPRMSRWMHRIALIRSLNHKAGCHNTLPSYTGLEQLLQDNTTTRDTYPPSMGSVCEWLRQ